MSKLILISLVLFVSLLGCSGGYGTLEEEMQSKEDIKVSADAYLFDAKLKQDGKPTSVRLYFYQTDSLIGVGGRGYLGKGALKGWISSDSIKVVFPTSSEYLYESVNDLFESFDCIGVINEFDIMSLFSVLPDSLFFNTNVRVTRLDDGSKEKRREFSISIDGCSWHIYIRYNKRDDRFIMRNFKFEDGSTTSFEGSRREFRANQQVSLSKFRVPESSDLFRIIP